MLYLKDVDRGFHVHMYIDIVLFRFGSIFRLVVYIEFLDLYFFYIYACGNIFVGLFFNISFHMNICMYMCVSCSLCFDWILGPQA